MKTLIVFYSLGGYTRYISEILARELEADTLELKTKKVYPQAGFKKFLYGGKSVIFKEEPELTNKNIDLNSYENIVIGTPVWAGKYAAPFNTFIKQYKFEGKNVAVFACHIGGGADKCLKLIKKSLNNNHFIGQTDFVNPLMNNKEKNAKKAINWARSLTF